MPRRVYSFDPPDRFVPGAVGQPGQRTFYLQARDGDTLVSVVCEKVQIAALADRLGALLEELRGRGVAIASEPSGGGGGLEEPVEDAFRAVTMTIGWDTRSEEVILEARAATDDDEDEGSEEDEDESEEFELDDDDDPDGPDLLRVRLTPSAVLDFIATARELLASGRPPCPWCGQPLEATGHYCARKNGNRAN